ncbi:hypothetical protein TRFO_26848 [Tritrichomonas foetus]|uniref:Uncharacterized protein n=1 Tax=Tritrichomonas foetus TaxID=1144522 RepID=A0A1J4K7N2_9EUKA|nr:hypothetical protein TRFO_26848 [Tritrichomonas foetus]|eukprot:OHT05429.1 hypothetical protein TRFO_26848 [Tritrichomonas foetus]
MNNDVSLLLPLKRELSKFTYSDSINKLPESINPDIHHHRTGFYLNQADFNIVHIKTSIELLIEMIVQVNYKPNNMIVNLYRNVTLNIFQITNLFMPLDDLFLEKRIYIDRIENAKMILNDINFYIPYFNSKNVTAISQYFKRIVQKLKNIIKEMDEMIEIIRLLKKSFIIDHPSNCNTKLKLKFVYLSMLSFKIVIFLQRIEYFDESLCENIEIINKLNLKLSVNHRKNNLVILKLLQNIDKLFLIVNDTFLYFIDNKYTPNDENYGLFRSMLEIERVCKVIISKIIQTHSLKILSILTKNSDFVYEDVISQALNYFFIECNMIIKKKEIVIAYQSITDYLKNQMNDRESLDISLISLVTLIIIEIPCYNIQKNLFDMLIEEIVKYQSTMIANCHGILLNGFHIIENNLEFIDESLLNSLNYYYITLCHLEKELQQESVICKQTYFEYFCACYPYFNQIEQKCICPGIKNDLNKIVCKMKYAIAFTSKIMNLFYYSLTSFVYNQASSLSDILAYPLTVSLDNRNKTNVHQAAIIFRKIQKIIAKTTQLNSFYLSSKLIQYLAQFSIVRNSFVNEINEMLNSDYFHLWKECVSAFSKLLSNYNSYLFQLPALLVFHDANSFSCGCLASYVCASINAEEYLNFKNLKYLPYFLVSLIFPISITPKLIREKLNIITDIDEISKRVTLLFHQSISLYDENEIVQSNQTNFMELVQSLLFLCDKDIKRIIISFRTSIPFKLKKKIRKAKECHTLIDLIEEKRVKNFCQIIFVTFVQSKRKQLRKFGYFWFKTFCRHPNTSKVAIKNVCQYFRAIILKKSHFHLKHFTSHISKLTVVVISNTDFLNKENDWFSNIISLVKKIIMNPAKCKSSLVQLYKNTNKIYYYLKYKKNGLEIDIKNALSIQKLIVLLQKEKLTFENKIFILKLVAKIQRYDQLNHSDNFDFNHLVSELWSIHKKSIVQIYNENHEKITSKYLALITHIQAVDIQELNIDCEVFLRDIILRINSIACILFNYTKENINSSLCSFLSNLFLSCISKTISSLIVCPNIDNLHRKIQMMPYLWQVLLFSIDFMNQIASISSHDDYGEILRSYHKFEMCYYDMIDFVTKCQLTPMHKIDESRVQKEKDELFSELLAIINYIILIYSNTMMCGWTDESLDEENIIDHISISRNLVTMMSDLYYLDNELSIESLFWEFEQKISTILNSVKKKKQSNDQKNKMTMLFRKFVVSSQSLLFNLEKISEKPIIKPMSSLAIKLSTNIKFPSFPILIPTSDIANTKFLNAYTNFSSHFHIFSEILSNKYSSPNDLFVSFQILCELSDKLSQTYINQILNNISSPVNQTNQLISLHNFLSSINSIQKTCKSRIAQKINDHKKEEEAMNLLKQSFQSLYDLNNDINLNSELINIDDHIDNDQPFILKMPILEFDQKMNGNSQLDQMENLSDISLPVFFSAINLLNDSVELVNSFLDSSSYSKSVIEKIIDNLSEATEFIYLWNDIIIDGKNESATELRAIAAVETFKKAILSLVTQILYKNDDIEAEYIHSVKSVMAQVQTFLQESYQIVSKKIEKEESEQRSIYEKLHDNIVFDNPLIPYYNSHYFLRELKQHLIKEEKVLEDYIAETSKKLS